MAASGLPGDEVPRVLRREKYAQMTPEEFETEVVGLLDQEFDGLTDVRVQWRETIAAHDGEYEFDATVRYSIGEFEFLVVVEAKRHRNAIKRETVQTLHAKMQSVHAQKGIVVATAPFQSGAIKYAQEHGIAVVSWTGERVTFLAHMAVHSFDGMARSEGQGFVAKAWRYTDATTIRRTVVSNAPAKAKALLLATEAESL